MAHRFGKQTMATINPADPVKACLRWARCPRGGGKPHGRPAEGRGGWAYGAATVGGNPRRPIESREESDHMENGVILAYLDRLGYRTPAAGFAPRLAEYMVLRPVSTMVTFQCSETLEWIVISPPLEIGRASCRERV